MLFFAGTDHIRANHIFTPRSILCHRKITHIKHRTYIAIDIIDKCDLWHSLSGRLCRRLRLRICLRPCLRPRHYLRLLHRFRLRPRLRLRRRPLQNVPRATDHPGPDLYTWSTPH